MSTTNSTVLSRKLTRAKQSSLDYKRGKYNQAKLLRDLIFIAMLAPTLIWLIIFRYIPMLGSLIAFQDFHVNRQGFVYSLLHSPWVGFDNFRFLFATSDAWVMTRNTLGYNFLFIFIGLVLSVLLAIMLYEVKNRNTVKFFQTVLILPNFLSWVAVSSLVYTFLATDNGVLNKVLAAFGVSTISWYQEPRYWPFILVFVNFWKTIGFGAVVYSAALAGVDLELYESARLDGANRFQQIRYISLPYLYPLMIILTILAIGRIFYSDFGLFYQIPHESSLLFPVTTVIDTYVYRALITLGNISMSTAAGLYQSVVGFILILATNLYIRRIKPEAALF